MSINNLSKIILIVALLTACQLGTANKNKYFIEEIEFKEITLDNSNIKKYPFLSQYIVDQESRRKKYNENYKSDMTLPDVFPEIRIYNSESFKLNEKNIRLFKIVGSTITGFCSNNGCQVNAYNRKGNYLFSFLDSGGIYRVSCTSKKYLVSGTGAGVNKPPYKIVSYSKPLLIESLEPSQICEILKKEENK